MYETVPSEGMMTTYCSCTALVLTVMPQYCWAVRLPPGWLGLSSYAITGKQACRIRGEHEGIHKRIGFGGAADAQTSPSKRLCPSSMTYYMYVLVLYNTPEAESGANSRLAMSMSDAPSDMIAPRF